MIRTGHSQKARNLLKKSLLLISLLIGLFLTSPSKANDVDEVDIPAKSAFAVELSTGKILYAKNSQKVLPVGPTSKLLTAYIVYREVAAGNINWSDKVSISDYPYYLTNLDVSNVPLEAREYTVKELTKAMLITSANGATIALAEHIAGSEPAFVDLMNQQLKDWGITKGKMVNATGLSNAYLGEENLYPGTSLDDENTLTAQDLAKVAYRLVTDFPAVTKLTQKSQSAFAKEPIHSYNLMLPNMPYFRGGVDGLATGTTEKAGSSFVASATTNGMRVITVILNADGWEENAGARFMATNDLLNHIAGHYYPFTILKEGKPLDKTKQAILDGQHNKVEPISKSALTVIKALGDKEKVIVYQPQTKTVFAPVTKGQPLGRFVYQDQHSVGDGYFGEPPSVAAIAKEPVQKSFFLKVWWNHFVRYVNDYL